MFASKLVHTVNVIFFPDGASGKEPTCHFRRHKRYEFDPSVGKIPWRTWQPTPVFLPGESCGQRSLAGYHPQGCRELDMAKVTQYVPVNFYFIEFLKQAPLSCIVTQKKELCREFVLLLFISRMRKLKFREVIWSVSYSQLVAKNAGSCVISKTPFQVSFHSGLV